ncbi:MAG: hypothetical protein CMJ59_16570 [Planctomycetaceae bacterium]|nr:hypothetical protein [Planctomycetaceae bacterium]
MTLHRVFLTFAAAISLACCPIAMAEDGEDEAAAPAKDEATALAKYDRWVTSLGFSPANNLLVTAGGQSLQYRPGDVKIWEATSGKLVASFEGHSSNVWSVAISADGKTLITSGYDGKVIVFDVESQKPTATLSRHKGWCRSVAITPDGKHFASAGEDGTVLIWDLTAEPKPLEQPPAPGPAEEAPALNVVKTIKAHEQAVYQVAFSRDGKALATASTDKTVKLWSWQEAEPKETAKLEGHGDAVWDVKFSADGSRIATASADRSIKLWDAAGKELATLVGHKDWVSNVAFSPDGKTIASTSHDRSTKLWNVELAMKLSAEVNATLTKLTENQTASQKATDELGPAQTEADQAQKRADAITAIVDSRRLPEELKQVEAALTLAKDNQILKEARDAAQKAAEVATKAAAERTKAFEGDKDFSAKLKTITEGPLPESQKEKQTADKAATDGANKVKSLNDQKTAADKAITEAKTKRDELSEQQAKTVSGYKGSVWTVAFSNDGKLFATGSHKDTLRVFALDEELKELHPSPPEEEAVEEEAAEEEAE